MTAKDMERRDPFTILVCALMDRAIDKTLSRYLRGVAASAEPLRDNMGRERWDSYRIRCPAAIARTEDMVIMLAGQVLNALMLRALEGGRHATVHLAGIGREHRTATARSVAYTLRDGGLDVRVRGRRSSGAEIFIRF